MKTSLLLAGVLTLGLTAGTSAFAQDVNTAGPASSMQNGANPQAAPAGSMGQTNSPAVVAGQPDLPDDGTAPGNRPNSDYGALDTGTADTNPGVQQPPTTRNADTTETRLPLKGANSFTEAEAVRRLQSAGYTQISGLAKDDQSIWRGTAMKGDEQVSIALDYKGNITDATK